MANVKIVRIATGEELIADIEEFDDGIDLKDIAILIPTQQNQLGLAPFMAYSDASERVFLDKRHIMFMVNPVPNLKSQWENMFSKIATPADPKIIV